MTSGRLWFERLPIFLGIIGLLCVAYAGARQLSYWIIPPLGLAFAAAYIFERKALWRQVLAGSSIPKVLRQLLVTVLIHQGMVAAVYFCCFGIAAVMMGGVAFHPFGTHELAVILMTAASFGTAALLKAKGNAMPRSEAGADSSDEAWILEQIEELSSSDVVMPATIFQIASRLDEQTLGFSSAVIEQCLANEESFHLRRIGFTALRYTGSREHPLLDVRTLLNKGFQDPHPWVRYDAIWAAEALGFNDDALRASLTDIADGFEVPPDEVKIPSSDALAQSRLRAARLLKQLEAGAAA